MNPSSSSSSSSGSIRSQLREPVAPYSPVFLDGWKPEVLRPDGQVWEDPVESQHKNEDPRVKQEVWNTCACHHWGIYSTVGGGKRAVLISDSKSGILVWIGNKARKVLIVSRKTYPTTFFWNIHQHQLELQFVHYWRLYILVPSEWTPGNVDKWQSKQDCPIFLNCPPNLLCRLTALHLKASAGMKWSRKCVDCFLV